MTPQTIRAVKAILEADPTLSDAQRRVILRACQKPEPPGRPKAVAETRLLTAKQVADALQISVRTVWRLVSEGQIRPQRIGERCTRFHLDDVRNLAGAVPDAR